MRKVYKKYLNNTTGTIIFLEDETVSLLGDMAASILHRLDDKLYYYNNNGFSEIASGDAAKKSEKKAEASEELPAISEELLVEATEEPGLDWVQPSEVKAKKKTNRSKQVDNEG